MASLSVVIITRNEEANIHDCLASCAFADEIVVVDSFSTDRTVEICREHACRVIQESWRGFGRQTIRPTPALDTAEEKLRPELDSVDSGPRSLVARRLLGPWS